MKNNKGFSLIELMVVVAIIGILASIAVPNFQRFQRRAKQSESKTQLGALFTAEVAFQAEYSTFTNTVDAIGYAPTGTILYNVGFGNGSAAAGTTTLFGATAVPSRFDSSKTLCAVEAFCQISGALTPDFAAAAAAPTAVAFTALSDGNIGGAQVDRWTMNQLKVYTNTQSGL